MNTGGLVFLALVVVSGTVHAELVEAVPEPGSSMFSSARLYGHVDTPTAQSWAERELSRLRQKSRQPFQIPGLRRSQPIRTGQDPLPKSLEALPVASPLSWESGDRGGGYDRSHDGLGLDRAVREALLESTLREMPKIATGVVDVLKKFSDGTVQLVFNLRRLMSQMQIVDVGKLVRKKASQASRHASGMKPPEENRADEKAKAALERETSKRRIKRVVASVFRIVIGICVGGFLWVLVRGSFR